MRRAVWLCSCSSVCLAGNSEVPEVGFGFRSGVSGVPSPCLFVEAHGVALLHVEAGNNWDVIIDDSDV
ncbi:hypothetical protein OPV22_012635 [Ensete ventricosum]|uniref:Secreted protein n=1 Tax=Ensete ventricosum TaxID=4639 RepID=A0AAV8PHA5_ENSVE|nr:hypothetical protein OPV22_012635 [Ensete ventricosum]